jgi:hypothetical protein
VSVMCVHGGIIVHVVHTHTHTHTRTHTCCTHLFLDRSIESRRTRVLHCAGTCPMIALLLRSRRVSAVSMDHASGREPLRWGDGSRPSVEAPDTTHHQAVTKSTQERLSRDTCAGAPHPTLLDGAWKDSAR